ncbi:hypothetical protein Pmar_PMAR013696 [Perkinsus marinus ATCC 50983]|uniref:Uncharacterized protein n=1 Tax=Perkinsus marinus (strain ATCC 50983 / TXsc) TaxID=423536 RepID=C5LY17_PERM5|nr:hypothetical protein Pmar_PMAR013696 [Perkinsus marinus ATCC 50983]EEQ98347.1 hypothetical protein Pmar_PMAR013696 [Perkinsus marinus ATCC 50983]|eukprot:XP_002765630.1 hypothetical protein Pmar_PMAR013696 [Perkinsus marinus ATCC 50983]
MTGLSDSFETRIAARRALGGSGAVGAAAVILQDATVQIREEGKEDQLVRRRRLKGTEMEETAEADFKTLSKPATHFGSRDEGSGGVFEMLLGAKKDEILREAVWVVCNLCAGGTPAQVRYVVEHYKGITATCTVLDVRDSRMVQVVLEAIEGILKVGCEVQEETGESTNRYLEMLEECGGLSRIEELQKNGSKGVYERAASILEGLAGVDWEVELFMAGRRLVDCSLKDLLGDQQIAWWLVGYGCDSYITGCGDTIGDGDRSSVGWSVYGDGLCDGFVEPLDPAHKLLFPGLQRKTDGDIVAWERRVETPEIEDTGQRPEGSWGGGRLGSVTPRNPLESGSKVKMSIGSSGTTKASLKEGAPMETPDATPMKWADTVGLGEKVLGARLGPVLGTFLHVEYPTAEEELSEDERPGASRQGSIEASVLSGSEELSVAKAGDSSDSREADVGRRRRRFRRRRSISDADLTYTAYLAELAMDQDGGGSLESDDMLSSDAREAHTLPPGDSCSEVDDAAALGSQERARDGQANRSVVAVPERRLNPDAPEFIPQYLSRSWLSMKGPPPGIGQRRTGGLWEPRVFR